MANLILTTNCQRKCAYCFAQEDKDKNVSFTMENFNTIMEFVSTGPKFINLLGGEPTLNKYFIEMLYSLIKNDFTIQVFTNGMLNEELLSNIVELLNGVVLKKDQLYFAININEEKYRSDEENKLQDKFLKTFGNLAYPSFTIQDKNTDLLFIKNIINKYNLDPTIRLGMAMPVKPGNNKYIMMEDYKEVAKDIITLSNNSDGIKIIFDCGFPLCMFTLEEINELNKNKENDFAYLCGQPLDIYPDLTFTNCYPLSQVYKGKISDFKNIMEVYTFLMKHFVAPFGIYGSTCTECSFFRKVCSGGCKGLFELPQMEVKDG